MSNVRLNALLEGPHLWVANVGKWPMMFLKSITQTYMRDLQTRNLIIMNLNYIIRKAQKKSSKKLKGLKSPTPKHVKDTVDPCSSSTPTDALADSQLGLHSSSVDTNSEDTLPNNQFECNYNSGNFFDEGIRTSTILLAQHLNNQDYSNFCPPTPPDAVRTLPDFLFESAKLTDEVDNPNNIQTQQLCNHFEIYNGQPLVFCLQENLYSPQMIALAPIPIDENIDSHSTVRYELAAFLCIRTFSI
ncbi:9608_t:CDS:2 [Paraglomus occultum]|uniref:9608_t:CDS:1 n=1 Tax=Paraglomus occultum TaxID=144539 RepID=A0A9N9C413_9GLOM|nr:9608_t:CDS:2 [Paraglomus occultum]